METEPPSHAKLFGKQRALRGARRRLLITVQGTVQGVGFRPFVYDLAIRHHLAGSVQNQSGAVSIDVEGTPAELEGFLDCLENTPPPLARIKSIDLTEFKPLDSDGFEIKDSSPTGDTEVFISPDIATCNDCLQELFDAANSRFKYPFINCTNCGPRLTIIEKVPYDRSRTTMKSFVLCKSCEKEYHDARNRRFHAQPVACELCGPKLSLFNRMGDRIDSPDPIATIAEALLNGQIAAIKGLGGYHLACDAKNSHAVSRLRETRHRYDKPFAVMVATHAHAHQLCEVDSGEEKALCSIERPIVLLKKRPVATLSPEVTQGSPLLGVMLPYTPLHHLLMRAVDDTPLVMTSGNDSDQPIVFRDEEVFARLGEIADTFLCHNRNIEVRCDDSVVWIEKKPTIKLRCNRRSRGYAPHPLRLPIESNAAVIALGAQQKNTFALLRNGNAILSHHIGDLSDFSTYQAFKKEVSRYETLFKSNARVLVHDLHPGYMSTRYAIERARREGLRRIEVQHHHAHMASCMAENGLNEKAIAVVFDGTGYGTDGKIWGGEFLVGDYSGFRRMAHLKYVPMPSGETAIREPWRMAYAHLVAANCEPEILAAQGAPISKQSLSLLSQIIRHELNSPMTSSMGRLFDAVASIIGLRHRISYEGQAAIELEWAAQKQALSTSLRNRYEFHLHQVSQDTSFWSIDPAPVIQAIVSDLKNGIPGPGIASLFHGAVSRMVGEICSLIRNETGLSKVVLSGGVFMNALLSVNIRSELENRHFEVFSHGLVPCNDGGVSLGQLAVAAAQLSQTHEDIPCA